MGNLHFKTNVQIKSIIGKDLINDDNIAIQPLEQLIKVEMSDLKEK